MNSSAGLQAGCVRTLLFALLALPAGVNAQPANWDSVLAAAKKEGRVVLYANSVPAVNERIKADFDKAYPGLVLEVSRIVGPAAVAKMDQERKANADGADATITTEILWLDERAKENALKPLSGPSARAWPAQYLRFGAAPIIALEPLTVVYNTSIVKAPLTGYQDLLRPEFKGRIGVSEPVSPAVVAWYDWLEKTQGGDFLAKFAAQAPRAYVGAQPTTQAAAAGEVSVAAFSNMTVPLPLIQQGAPLRIVITKPSLGILYGAGGAAWSKRPNATLVLMDYLTSVRGQTTISGRGETASPLPGIQGALDVKSINPLDPGRYTPAVVSAFKERWNRLFKAK